MKIVLKVIMLNIIFAVTIVFCTGCSESDVSEPVKKNQTHFANSLVINDEQVWLPNYNTTKISNSSIKYSDNGIIDITVGMPDEGFVKVGSGQIEEGNLSFNISALDEDKLLDKNDLFSAYFNYGAGYGWYGSVDMDVDAKCNIITLVTQYKDGQPSEVVIKEGFYGTRSSLTGEYIYFIYTDKDCKIASERVEFSDFYSIFEAFDIQLKKGWNTLCRSETYMTEGGHSTYKMEIKNPDIKWLLFELD